MIGARSAEMKGSAPALRELLADGERDTYTNTKQWRKPPSLWVEKTCFPVFSFIILKYYRPERNLKSSLSTPSFLWITMA
jgi:hypothetical protein